MDTIAMMLLACAIGTLFIASLITVPLMYKWLSNLNTVATNNLAIFQHERPDTRFFTLFPNLSRELRALIWEAALPDYKRTVYIFLHKDNKGELPAIFFVNRESAEFARKHFVFFLPYISSELRKLPECVERSTILTFFNPKVDKVCINGQILFNPWMTYSLVGSLHVRYATLLSKITSLELTNPGYFIFQHRSQLRYKQNSEPAMLAFFPGLKKLVLAYSRKGEWWRPTMPPSPPDMEIVVGLNKEDQEVIVKYLRGFVSLYGIGKENGGPEIVFKALKD